MFRRRIRQDDQPKVNHDRRRFPIKRDQFGDSARKRAFAKFDSGMRPKDVYEDVDISMRTCLRYFQDWKRRGKNFSVRLDALSRIMKPGPEYSPTLLDTIGEQLGMPRWMVLWRLERPWGLLQLIDGKWPNFRRDDAWSRQEARLKAVADIVVMYEKFGVPLERIGSVFDQLHAQVRASKRVRRSD